MPHVLSWPMFFSPSVLLAALGCEGHRRRPHLRSTTSPVSAACVARKDEGKAKIKTSCSMPAAGASHGEFTRTSGQQLSGHVTGCGLRLLTTIR